MSIGPWAVLLDEYQNARLVGFHSRLSAAAGSPGKKTLETRERAEGRCGTLTEGVGGWGVEGFHAQHPEGLAEFLSYTFRNKKF